MPSAFILILLSMSFTNPKPLFHSSSGIRMQEDNHSDTVRIKFSPEARKLTGKGYNSDPNRALLAQRDHVPEIKLRVPCISDTVF